MEKQIAISMQRKALIGDLIAMRRTRKMNQDDMASMTGLSKGTIVSIESMAKNSKYEITLTNLVKYIHALNQDVSLMLSPHVDPVQPPKPEVSEHSALSMSP